MTTKKNAAVRSCRHCGCTDDRACSGGCYWVEWDLCSKCRPPSNGKRDRRPARGIKGRALP